MSLQATLPLAEMPDSDVALALAKQAVYTRHIRTMQKQAMPEFLQTAMDTAKANPTLLAGLAGAGLGAGVGGLASTGTPERKRHFWRNMLTGALAGGAAAGGGAYALGQLGGGAKPPQETFVHGGKKRALIPSKTTPEVLQEVSRLQTSTPTEKALYGAGNVLMKYPENHPLLAGILGADLAGGVAKGYERLWHRNLPHVTLDPDSIFDAAMRGKFDVLATGGKGGKDKELGGAVKQLVESLKGGEKQIDRDALRTALVAARSGAPSDLINVPGISQPIPASTLERLTELSGGRVTSGPGVLQRMISRWKGEPADPLALSGWKYNAPDTTAITDDMRKTFAGKLGKDPATFIGKDKELRNELRRWIYAARSGKGKKPTPAELLYGALGIEERAPVLGGVADAGATAAVKQRRAILDAIQDQGSVEAVPLWNAKGKWSKRLAERGGAIARYMHSGPTGGAFRQRIPHLKAMGRAGLYAGVPLLQHVYGALRSGNQRSKELQQLLEQISTEAK